MVLQPGTIHEVLNRRNPQLDVRTGKGSLTYDATWIRIKEADIKPVRCNPTTPVHLQNYDTQPLTIHSSSGKSSLIKH